MNLLKVLGLFTANTAKDVAAVGMKNLRLTLRLLYVSITVPAVLLVLGIAIGAVGDATESAGVVSTGKGFITAGSFIATVLLLLFWVRATVFAHVIYFVSKGAEAISASVPAADLFQIKKFSQWLRGVTVWISLACMYSSLIPVWRHIGWSAMAYMAIIVMSGMMSAGWGGGKLARVAATVAVVSLFVFSTAALISPRFARSLTVYAEGYFGRYTDMGEREERMTEVTRESDRTAAEVDQALLRRFLNDRTAIRRRAAELCGGNYCSEEERRIAAELDERIERLRRGTYWEHERAATAASPAVSSDASSSVVDMPPPPPPPRRVVTDRPNGEAASVRSSPYDEEVRRMCERYPDACR